MKIKEKLYKFCIATRLKIGELSLGRYPGASLIFCNLAIQTDNTLTETVMIISIGKW